MNCRRDPAFMLSIIFTILSFGLLTISYSKIFIEFPLSKLMRVVDQHSEQIDTLSKSVNSHSVKLANHDVKFAAILDETFSHEFSEKIRKNLHEQK